MSAPLIRIQSPPNLSQPGLLYKAKQTPGGNCFLIWVSKADKQSFGVFATSAYLVFSEKNSAFLLRRQGSGEKTQKSGRAVCGSVTSMKP